MTREIERLIDMVARLNVTQARWRDSRGRIKWARDTEILQLEYLRLVNQVMVVDPELACGVTRI